MQKQMQVFLKPPTDYTVIKMKNVQAREMKKELHINAIHPKIRCRTLLFTSFFMPS